MLNATNFRLSALIVFLFFFKLSAFSQYWEAGGFIGASNYSGDLARRVVLSETNISVGALGKYNFSEYWSWKFGINYAKVSGGDYNFKEYQKRNLEFFSHIWEIDNRVEFNFIRFGTGVLSKRSTPFFFAGINMFYFNPKTDFRGSVVRLQPLGTEGQNIEGNKRYKQIGIALPIGMGYKYSLSPNWVFGAEIGVRKTFTDHLDDVSGIYPNFEKLQSSSGSAAVALSDRSVELDGRTHLATEGNFRGDPTIKDWYFIAGISLTYRFTPIRCMFTKY